MRHGAAENCLQQQVESGHDQSIAEPFIQQRQATISPNQPLKLRDISSVKNLMMAKSACLLIHR